MLRFLFSPFGRVSRQTYWLNWIVPYFVASIVVALLDTALWPESPITHRPPPYLRMIFSLVVIWPSLAVATKRLHDRGMTGWWNLVHLVGFFVIATVSYWYYTTVASGVEPTAAFEALSQPIKIGSILVTAAYLVISLYLLVNILFLRGQTGDNRYGHDPLAENQAEVFS